MTQKLYRSNDRVLGGVCAGLAEYFDFDPTLVRIAYAFLAVCTVFPGLILYIIMWIVMPAKNNITA
ncbi:MAG: PspC domain-containing protein [Prevotella sp.]|nr:PspC domain-containing protein [Prevotella sp.]